MRVCATHAWPLFISEANLSPWTVVARSASSRTIAADLPPSSRLTRLSCSPQIAAMRRPAAVEPVNAILSTPGWRTRCSPTSRPAGTTLTTPFGMPASSTRSAMRNASSGVSGDGFTTIVHPAISAGASFDMMTNCGTFHGTIAPTTPAGSRRRHGAVDVGLGPFGHPPDELFRVGGDHVDGAGARRLHPLAPDEQPLVVAHLRPPRCP